MVRVTPRLVARLSGIGSVMQVVPAVLAALVLATVVRGVTAELNQSVGRLWPFALDHCYSPASPGCPGAGYSAARHDPIPHVTSGRL